MTSKKPANDEMMKKAVLDAALPDAAFDGFTDKVLEKASRAAGVDASSQARLFPEGAMSLIEFYSHDVDAAMAAALADMDLASMKIRARIRAAVKARLAALAPHKEAARRAASALMLPGHAGLSMRLMYASVDAMWRAGGDTSTDFNFYTKRAILAGVYGATLLRWFNDDKDAAATDAFLDARIENVMQFEKLKGNAKKAFGDFRARKPA
jgi:ubiquinone biosynthesis protein COQ9